MTRTALVLRHDRSIHLGNLEAVLLEHGYDIQHVDSHEELRLVDPLGADLVVVLGGEMGAYEGDTHPVLADEVVLLRTRLRAERPVLGVCLGAQLMASALDAPVFPGASNEIGFRLVEPTRAGAASPVRHFTGVPVMQWHSDTFELPAGTTRLAGSAQYGNEAFGIDEWALAVQFHPEVTDEMHEDWLTKSATEVAATGLDPDELRRERAHYSAGMQAASRAMLSEWLDGLDPRKTE